MTLFQFTTFKTDGCTVLLLSINPSSVWWTGQRLIADVLGISSHRHGTNYRTPDGGKFSGNFENFYHFDTALYTKDHITDCYGQW